MNLKLSMGNEEKRLAPTSQLDKEMMKSGRRREEDLANYEDDSVEIFLFRVL